MATKKAMTPARKPVEKPVEPAVEQTVKTAVEAEPVVEKQKRVYSYDDYIPCISITAGEYLFEGEKSKTVYSWMDAGIVEDVRYDDLTSAIRTRKPVIFKPRIVIEDDEFLESYPNLRKLYDSMYSKDDLMQILGLEPSQMIKVIEQLPEGAKDAIKSLAVRSIDNGTYDSIKGVRALDQYFGTDMLLKLAQ